MYYQFSLPHIYISLLKVGRMYFLNLRVKGLITDLDYTKIVESFDCAVLNLLPKNPHFTLLSRNVLITVN